MNIKELTMRAIKEERKVAEQRIKRLAPLRELSLDIPNVIDSTTLGYGLMLLCGGNDYRPAYRALRKASGQRPLRQSVFPEREPSTRASVSLEFKISDTSVVLSFTVEDFRKFIKPGANCRRQSMSDRIVCE